LAQAARASPASGPQRSAQLGAASTIITKPMAPGGAHADHPELLAAAAQLVEERHRDAPARGAERVADGDGAAHHVDAVLGRNADRPVAPQPLARDLVRVEPLQVGEHLRRERLVDLQQGDVLDGEPRAVQATGRGVHRPLSSWSSGASAAYA
jgi:hypothetical protein